MDIPLEEHIGKWVSIRNNTSLRVRSDVVTAVLIAVPSLLLNAFS